MCVLCSQPREVQHPSSSHQPAPSTAAPVVARPDLSKQPCRTLRSVPAALPFAQQQIARSLARQEVLASARASSRVCVAHRTPSPCPLAELLARARLRPDIRPRARPCRTARPRAFAQTLARARASLPCRASAQPARVLAVPARQQPQARVAVPREFPEPSLLFYYCLDVLDADYYWFARFPLASSGLFRSLGFVCRSLPTKVRISYRGCVDPAVYL